MEGPRCYRCRTFGHPFSFDRAWGSFYYAGWIKRLLHVAKFRPSPEVFRRLTMHTHLDWPLGMDRVVPIPGHPANQRIRGFSPTHLLAREVSAFYRIPRTPGLIPRPTGKPQRARSQKERLQQAFMDRFSWNGPSLKGETVLLVDDILTTGATAHAAARTLKKAGASRVWVWTVAQEVPHAFLPVELINLESMREVHV